VPEINSNYSTVSPPWWDEVWIVAGGASSAAFDYSQLGKTVLAVNDGIYRVSSARPDLLRSGLSAVALFSLDNGWVHSHRHFLSEFPGEKFVALPLETWPECAGIDGVQYLQWGFQSGLSEDPGVLNTGGNSGYAAINLAYLKRASRIHLIGYDMDPSHDEKYEQWIPRFRTMRTQLEARGVTVINHNPHSFVDAFR
jgi:hypothetical protein